MIVSWSCRGCGETLGYSPKLCAACRTIGYCGRACQVLHWPVHKLDCATFKLQREGKLGPDFPTFPNYGLDDELTTDDMEFAFELWSSWKENSFWERLLKYITVELEDKLQKHFGKTLFEVDEMNAIEYGLRMSSFILKERVTGIRTAALYAMRESDVPAAISLFLYALREDPKNLTTQVCLGLLFPHHPRCLSFLKSALHSPVNLLDQHWVLESCATLLLEMVPQDQSKASIIEYLNDLKAVLELGATKTLLDDKVVFTGLGLWRKFIFPHEDSVNKSLEIIEALKNPFFKAVMCNGPILSDFNEHTLKWLRGGMLHTHRQVKGSHPGILLCLSQQNFFLDHAWEVDEEEQVACNQLIKEVEAQILQLNKVKHNKTLSDDLCCNLMILSMFLPLRKTLPSIKKLQDYDVPSERGVLSDILSTQLDEALEEEELEKTIATIGPIRDPISIQVRDACEKYPHPRWRSIYSTPLIPKGPLLLSLQARAPYHNFSTIFNNHSERDPVLILNAACGTGVCTIEELSYCENVKTLAVDLSRKSLAYGQRMANMFGIPESKLKFAQGDMLELSPEILGKKFHYITVSNMLRNNIKESIKALASCLLDGGVLKFAVYSKKHVQKVWLDRVLLHDKFKDPIFGAPDETTGFSPLLREPTDYELRRARALVLASNAVSRELGVYCLNGFYDYLFNTQESWVDSWVELKNLVEECGLKWIGSLNSYESERIDAAALDALLETNPKGGDDFFKILCEKPETSKNKSAMDNRPNSQANEPSPSPSASNNNTTIRISLSAVCNPGDHQKRHRRKKNRKR